MKSRFILILLLLLYGCAENNTSVPQPIIEDTYGLPDYWVVHLKEKIQQIQKYEINNSSYTSFFFLTDYHIENNAGFSHLIVECLQNNCSTSSLVFGGDVFNGSSSKNVALGYIKEFYNRFNKTKVFGIRGNHEFNLIDGGSRDVMLSDEDVYEYFIKNISDEVILGKSGSLYYYKDLISSKIRCIYLDSQPINDEQIKWMEHCILDLSSDWSVILFSHHLFGFIPPRSSTAEIKQTEYCSSGKLIIESLASIKPAATIIAIISGHCHYDYSTNEHGFWEISTTCDSRQEGSNLPQTLETINEHALDVFYINQSLRTIDAIRIGRGVNRSWSY